MALKVGELYAVLSLNKEGFDRGLKDSGGSLNTLKNVAVGVAAGIVGALALIGGAAVKAAADFEQNMASVATILGESTPGRLNELGEAVKAMSLATGKDLGDLSAGLYDVIGTFGDIPDAVGWLEVAARAGSAGMATTKESIGLLAMVTKAYGDTSLEAAQKAADLAFQTANLGVTTFPEMAASMGKILPVAATMKISQEELFAAMATLTGVTGNTSEVVTQLNSSMRSFLKPNKDMKAALKELGYEGGDAGKKLVEEKGLVGALKAITETSVSSEKGLTSVLGRSEAYVATLYLTGEGADVFASKLEAMANVAGVTGEAFQTQQATVSSSMARIMAAVNVALVSIGEKFLPMLSDFLTWVLTYAPVISELFEGLFTSIRDAIQTISDTVLPALTGALGDAQSEGFDPFTTTLNVLKDDVLPAVTAAFDWISTHVFPVFLAMISLVATVTSAIVDVFNTVADVAGPALGEIFQWLGDEVLPVVEEALAWISDTVLPNIGQAFQDVADIVGPVLGEAIKAFAETILPPLKDGFEFLINDVMPVLADLWEEFSNDIFPAFASAVGDIVDVVWPPLQKLFQDASAVIVPALQTAFDLISNDVLPPLRDAFKAVSDFIAANWPAFQSLVETVMEAVGAAIDLVSPTIDGLATLFTNVGDTIGDVLDDIRTAFNNIVTFFKDVWGKIVNAVKTPVNLIIDMLNGLSNAFAFRIAFDLPSFDVPDPTQLLEGGTIKIGGGSVDWSRGPLFDPIPHFNSGAWRLPNNSLAMLHAGEMVIPPAYADMIRERFSGWRDMGNGGSGGGMPITQNIYGMQPDEVERQTRRAIRRESLGWKVRGAFAG